MAEAPLPEKASAEPKKEVSDVEHKPRLRPPASKDAGQHGCTVSLQQGTRVTARVSAPPTSGRSDPPAFWGHVPAARPHRSWRQLVGQLEGAGADAEKSACGPRRPRAARRIAPPCGPQPEDSARGHRLGKLQSEKGDPAHGRTRPEGRRRPAGPKGEKGDTGPAGPPVRPARKARGARRARQERRWRWMPPSPCRRGGRCQGRRQRVGRESRCQPYSQLRWFFLRRAVRPTVSTDSPLRPRQPTPVQAAALPPTRCSSCMRKGAEDGKGNLCGAGGVARRMKKKAYVGGGGQRPVQSEDVRRRREQGEAVLQRRAGVCRDGCASRGPEVRRKGRGGRKQRAHRGGRFAGTASNAVCNTVDAYDTSPHPDGPGGAGGQAVSAFRRAAQGVCSVCGRDCYADRPRGAITRWMPTTPPSPDVSRRAEQDADEGWAARCLAPVRSLPEAVRAALTTGGALRPWTSTMRPSPDGGHAAVHQTVLPGGRDRRELCPLLGRQAPPRMAVLWWTLYDLPQPTPQLCRLRQCRRLCPLCGRYGRCGDVYDASLTKTTVSILSAARQPNAVTAGGYAFFKAAMSPARWMSATPR